MAGSPKCPKKCSKTPLISIQPKRSPNTAQCQKATCHICGINLDLENLNKHVQIHLKNLTTRPTPRILKRKNPTVQNNNQTR